MNTEKMRTKLLNLDYKIKKLKAVFQAGVVARASGKLSADNPYSLLTDKKSLEGLGSWLGY